jgi:hypothetical protein
LLASKYDITYLRRRALARFREFYPDDFDVWSDEKRWPDEKAWWDSAPNHTTLDSARQVGILCVIPTIMLRMCFRGIEGVLSANLSSGDQRSILVGMARLQRYIRLTIYAWLYRTAPGCQSQTKCGQINARVLRSLEEAPWRVNHDPLEMNPGWKGFHARHLERDYTCRACKSAVDECYTKGRREIWSKLPSIFELPSWEELLRESRLE